MRHLLALLPLFAAACLDPKETGIACTDVGCTDGFYVSFERAAWNAGTWTFDVTVDDAAVTCQATIPLGSGAADGCTDDLVMIELSGSELPVEEQSIPGMLIGVTDATTIRIAVSLDGTQVALQDFTPEYVTSQPNGPDCEPTCVYDGVTMAL